MMGPTEPTSTQDFGLFRPGDLIGSRFRVVNLIGQGGMANVYAVEDTDLVLQPMLALKVLKPDSISDQRAITRFRDEIRAGRHT